MKMLQEANLDTLFNTELGKIQTAIEKLENLALRFKLSNTSAVNSQLSALELARDDLSQLHKTYKNLK